MTDTRQRILLVDSEQDWLAFSKKALEEAGYSATTASSLTELNKVFSKADRAFDLILLDLQYAKEDGGLLGELARSCSVDRCIVVLFPTQMMPLQMIEFFRLGVVQDCVDKQYDKERVISLVREQLQKRRVSGNTKFQRTCVAA
jgi:DNA-binding NtrC family response regulator